MCWLHSQWGDLSVGHKGVREREREMVCVISPFLPFFAFDSKMDDCNHRSHQWDKMEVYGAARHSHGNPAVRLLHHAAMGTLRCLFVEGFVVSYAFSSPFSPPLWGLLMCRTWKLPHKICVGWARGTEKESVYTSQHSKPTVSQYVC